MSATDIVLAAAGTGGEEPTYVEDVFSTYLYTGTAPTNQTINNGIDLSGKGGMVWFKGRNTAGTGAANVVVDTTRGRASTIKTHLTDAAATSSTGVDFVSFNSNGFTVGDAEQVSLNNSGLPTNYVSWTFAEQEKFFDVVTYTGNGTEAISHNLGSVPGMIIVKKTNASGTNWMVYHRSSAKSGFTAAQSVLKLNLTNAVTDDDVWTNTAPTSTTFYVKDGNSSVNANGETYVAYLFAHDAGGFGESGTDNVISCGSVTASGGVLPDVNLGWEPQWLIMKNVTTGSTYWDMQDNMRGSTYGGNVQRLRANVPWAENADTTQYGFTSTGLNGASTSGFGNDTYIYMAIRRPMKVPTSGTQVFKPILNTGTGATKTISGIGFAPDAVFGHARDAGFLSGGVIDRLRGVNQWLATDSTGAEGTYTNSISQLNNDSWVVGSDDTGSYNYSTWNYVSWNFRRASGFFDEVCYTGTGSLPGVTHNLGVTPELKIIKRRNFTTDWIVGGSILGEDSRLFLNLTDAVATSSNYWDGGDDSSTVFSVRNTNSASDSSGGTYVAYLFATVAGVSKVGSYTGTGATQTINCGFTGGARFVMIKRTDAEDSWHVFDTARGIVAGNDPYLVLNDTVAEAAGYDLIDADSSGFTINTNFSGFNASGGTYIYLAIA